VQTLRQYGYVVTRQTGSHIRLKSTLRGADHHITIPAHPTLKLGTLNAIILVFQRIWMSIAPASP